MALAPRVAVFDCDGTLWSGDAGEDFLYWEVGQGILSRNAAAWVIPRYKSYKQGQVGEAQMCGEMVSVHRGLMVEDLEAAAERFFAQAVEARIFPEMQELTSRLTAAGCQLWAVSSTNEWVVRAGVRRFGIPQENVLAACVECRDGRVGGRIIAVPTDEAKAEVINAKLGPDAIDACFGNSIHDAAMLEMARHAFAIEPTPELLELAKQRAWTVYEPIKLNS